ncbi:hypothetical protein FIBSPDRAFT_1036627 [Athelia psychrophila]|uniref:CipC-like antibiotic response protein n=1 Tax=Athelia psychrophila TaxID=1759441 RepID=A0A166VSM9_9AGAM|nr:hypothetical protein FIBSPDRAFT_1036627 [Fibularhizoctonia sp. CBS 109695]
MSFHIMPGYICSYPFNTLPTTSITITTMGWFDGNESQSTEYQQTDNDGLQQHEPKKMHELIGGAAAYEAAKAYENRSGKPSEHAKAKEIMAGLAGAFIDREIETKGLNFIDRERAKAHANQQIENDYSEQAHADYQ